MSKIGSTLVALVVGAAIGASVEILFAPDEGKKTRKRIRKSLEGVSDNLKDKLTHLNENLKEKKLKRLRKVKIHKGFIAVEPRCD